VEITLDDNGTTFPCEMVAGHIGMSVVGENQATVQPHSAWFMYVKREVEEGEPGKDLRPFDVLDR
jgi:hypothetical protein